MDLLTEREFNQGFGSHTPMFTGQASAAGRGPLRALEPCLALKAPRLQAWSPFLRPPPLFLCRPPPACCMLRARYVGSRGCPSTARCSCAATPPPPPPAMQTKCVRYYMVFDRALRVMKRCLEAEGHATDANNAPGGPRLLAPPVAQAASCPPLSSPRINAPSATVLSHADVLSSQHGSDGASWPLFLPAVLQCRWTARRSARRCRPPSPPQTCGVRSARTAG